METKFFQLSNVQQPLTEFLTFLSSLNETEIFKSERNTVFSQMLGYLISGGKECDKYAKISIEKNGENLIQHLSQKNPDNEWIDIGYAFCFDFFVEIAIYSPLSIDNNIVNPKAFTLHNLDSFSSSAKGKILYSLHSKPGDIISNIVNSDAVKSVDTFIKANSDMTALKNEIEQTIKNKEDRVEKLNETLTNQSIAFNYVNLSKGFHNLSDAKKLEQKKSKSVTFALGCTIPAFIILSSLAYYAMGVKFDTPTDIIKTLPTISVTILLAYYFRITLSNHNSIKAQIIQIDLRKTLCEFIQGYSEYSQKIKEKDVSLLSKFEDVIFSNIMTSGDKMPSTFDGIEQLASLISSTKK